MNSQPAHRYPDARIDQILNALRTTEAPSGLEQRVAARLAQAAEARTLTTSPLVPAAHAASRSLFSVILTLSLPKGKDPRILFAAGAKRYTVAAGLTLLAALTALTLLHHRAPLTTAQITPNSSTPFAHNQAVASSLEGAGLQSRHNAPTRTVALAAEEISQPRPYPTSTEQPDLDAIALAETLAPSRPAKPLPLTAQEKLILSATRPGQPIQLAELDLARAPILRAAAEARETASIDRYVKSLLAPFAVADELSPTTFSQPQETSTPPPPPTSSPSN
jgi:hypothetical protein